MAGGLTGLAIGKALPQDYQGLAQSAIGVGTLAMGIKLFLESKNILVPIGALILGGMIGHLLGFQDGINALGMWAQEQFGDTSGKFQEAFVTTSILFCVGPMTVLGCLEDGLQGKIRLLGLKSILDGVSSVFFAASLGIGVLLSAGTVLLVQGALTLGARSMRKIAESEHILSEITGSGGLILIMIGLGLLELRALPTADFLPALLFAGIAGSLFLKPKNQAQNPPSDNP